MILARDSLLLRLSVPLRYVIVVVSVARFKTKLLIPFIIVEYIGVGDSMVGFMKFSALALNRR